MGGDDSFCFDFFDVPSLVRTDRDAELIWRIKASLKNALELLSKLQPDTRRLFPLQEILGDPERGPEFVGLESLERHLQAYVKLVESAQKSASITSADTMCVLCLCNAFNKHHGLPGIGTSGPFIDFVHAAYSGHDRKCPSPESIKRVARAWRQRAQI